jgi:hypothetical protein
MFTTTYGLTAGHLPKEIRQYRNPYLPRPRQKARLLGGAAS